MITPICSAWLASSELFTLSFATAIAAIWLLAFTDCHRCEMLNLRNATSQISTKSIQPD